MNEKSLKDEPEDGIISYFIRILQIPMIQCSNNTIKLVTSKSFILILNSGNLRNIMEFDIKSKQRLDMFSNGYQDAFNKLKSISN